MRRIHSNRVWAVVLAAGDGRRLAPLTRALYGRDLPKQFAVIDGERSLLQATLDRVGTLVPARQTVVVVSQAYAELAREQLAAYPGVDLVTQPRNLDTAPGILLPLSRIQARDPEATVAIFPSDHYISRPEPFVDAVRRAAELSVRCANLITLLGVVPERAETEYGYILPGERLRRSVARGVLRFVEKPAELLAERLARQGGLWNTFVSAGQLSCYLELAARYLPGHAALFELYARSIGKVAESSVLETIYATMTPANFSRSILEHTDRLAVLPVSGSGWSDWGSPARIFAALQGTSRLDALRARLALADIPAVA